MWSLPAPRFRSRVAEYRPLLLFVEYLVPKIVLTADPSQWFFWPSALAIVLVTTIAAYGFRAALAGRPAFGKPILEA